jgi:hypothetical protein
MTDLDDLDHASLIIYRVDDAEGTLADPITLLVSGELLTAAWARSLCEALDAGDDADADGARFDGFELLGRGRLDEDAIACHAAEGP